MACEFKMKSVVYAKDTVGELAWRKLRESALASSVVASLAIPAWLSACTPPHTTPHTRATGAATEEGG